MIPHPHRPNNNLPSLTGIRQRTPTFAAIALFACLTGATLEARAADCPAGSEEYAAYQRTLVFERFSHQRLGATACYPVTLFPTMAPTPDGFRFSSDDGLAWFTLTRDVQDERGSIQGVMEEAKRDLLARSASVTYSRTKDNWFVLSGYIDDRIYYRRTIIDDAGLATETLYISIPAEQKTFYYDIIARMSWSFRLR